MQRVYDLSQYPPDEIHRFGSLREFFASPIRNGVSEIEIGDRPFHALFRNRGTAATLITFASAMPVKGWDTYPHLPGEKTAKGLKVSHLSLSDPNFALEGRPATGWFLGSAHNPIVNVLPEIINHATKPGIEGQAVHFGTSAGGFAALYYGAQAPESVTVAINPRVELLRKPTQFHRLTPVSFPGVTAEELLERVPTSAAIPASGETNTVAYIQNVQDTPYFEENMLPYLAAADGNERVWMHLLDSGPRHVMPEGPLVTNVLRALFDNSPDWPTALAKFDFNPGVDVEWALEQRKTIIGKN